MQTGIPHETAGKEDDEVAEEKKKPRRSSASRSRDPPAYIWLYHRRVYREYGV